jgi:hypothetical protein
LRKEFRIVWIVAIVLAIAWFAAIQYYPGKAAVKLKPQACDAKLWDHVYEKDRLRIIEACTAVEGRVVSLNRGSDGDLHIGLDPEQRSILNLINVIHGHRELVVEVICEHPATKEAAKHACSGFHSQVGAPNIGDRVRVTGAYVTDREVGWNEIHPVTQIELLP